MRDELVLGVKGRDRSPKASLSVIHADQFHLHPDQVHARGDNLKKRQRGSPGDLLCPYLAEEDWIGPPRRARVYEAKAACAVTLRVHVDEEGSPLRKGEAGRQIDCRCSLSNPALLVGNCDNLCHWISLPAGGFHVKHPPFEAQ